MPFCKFYADSDGNNSNLIVQDFAHTRQASQQPLSVNILEITSFTDIDHQRIRGKTVGTRAFTKLADK